MTVEEKLQHFTNACMADARQRANKMIDDYKDALEKSFEEHKHDEARRADMQIKLACEKIEKEGNKDLAIEHMKLRKQFGAKQEELKNKLFTEIKDKLEKFMTTPEYQKLLEAQVKYAIDFAGDDELVIYMDPADGELINRISLHHGFPITASQYSFMGGTRAVIPHKNILIDNSFESKLEKAKEHFHFEIGGNADA